ncbi:hypothetical protein GC170_02210 [bacterium]|nr:hypothetical protein [bacterium]
MATVLDTRTAFRTDKKVRFAHRYKMVVPERPKSAVAPARRMWAEAPDAGNSRRGAEAGEMWTRNAEAPDSGQGRH